MTRTALVVGAGGSLGSALCAALSERGFRVVAAGRNRAALEAEVAADQFLEIEVSSVSSMAELATVGPLDVVVYNAGRLDLATLADTTPDMFTQSWQVNALGAFLCARAVTPHMTERGHGTMLFVGATASIRSGARTHAFSSAKHALRGLSSALAKELGPRGIHVAHIILDGKLWGDRTRRRFPDVTEARCLQPAAVAHTMMQVIEQPSSAWTFELDLRPHDEKWS